MRVYNKYYVVTGCLAVYVEVSPREVLALPGQNATFLCRVAVPIQYCRVEVPGMEHLNLNPNAAPFEGVSFFFNFQVCTYLFSVSRTR